MHERARTLRTGFLASAERYPDRPALTVDGQPITYRELRDRAARIAATLERAVRDHGVREDYALTAIYGHRHVSTFAGILGALLRGHGYVPLNPVFPPDRTRAMLDRSQVRCLIVDGHARATLGEVLHGIERELVILMPDASEDEVAAERVKYPTHRVLGAHDLAPASDWAPREVDENGIAYLLFTSGSTGVPKGVMVAHRNVVAFLDSMIERYQPTPEDRFSHTFDLTFDLSVFDLFMAWWSGACVCCPTAQQKAFPGKYATSSDITIWFSVPSTAVLMNKLRMLKEGTYPKMRYALFCGEALPVEVTQQFAKAAPSAVLENLYGPTELTIACTLYRWDVETSPRESELGVVPIGDAYPGMEIKVVDEELREVPPGETGELLMTGSQLTLGYFRDEERTAKAFVVPPGETRVFYRTGDRVRKPKDGLPMVYLGRVDNQIKIQGYRVELGEIEAVLRDVAQCDVAIAIGWPKSASGADGVVGFVGLDHGDADAIRAAANERLPPYMQPREIRFVREWPLNANGKVDRKVLTSWLAEGKTA
ncbi:amino acid adenylation domain-containing protein [Sandaracinus amylolyticus]|uniref:amino acid adenylation domain-containing protein n=1 Tax=Sandaracinus amylolyticus TaxID=927083 RepID=UPI001F18AB49|nr:amino acid adenylation domain-containing protein [Sandaracinus amylolyticus]UJR80244.1 Nonribosomal peptide synthetase, discrete adenylation domain [Sandaracinus amylolyticus]